MIFSSAPFLIFFPSVLILFWLARSFGFARLSLDFLTLASLVYYAWWDLWYVPLIIGTVAFNFILGRIILERRATKKNNGAFLTLGVIINLAPLVYWKYTGFILTQFEPLFGSIGTGFHFLLPLGISFYTFQQIAYIVDISRGLPAERSFRNYALFVLFFPQLIAGPIVHHGEVMHQFLRGSRRPSLDIAVGLTIFTAGLAKKLIFADGFAAYANPVFSGAEAGLHPDGLDAWIAAISYVFQLYFDFSGYSDMAIGLARCFGITLPINFNSPYKSKTISEFWRNWHITLVRFVRSYLFQPMALSFGRWAAYQDMPRKVSYWAQAVVPTIIIFALIGLWHGAGWSFIVFGLIHGVIVSFEQAVGFGNKAQRATLLWKVFGWAWVPLILVTSFVIFRAGNLSASWIILKAMANVSDSSWPTPTIGWIVLFTLSVVICRFVPNVYQLMQRYQPVLIASDAPPLKKLAPEWPRWRATLAYGLMAGLILTVSVIQMARGVVEFIYFEF